MCALAAAYAALDLATAEIRQYTDVVGGCFSPVELAPRGGENVLAYTAYYEGTFRLYRMPLRQPEARLAPGEAEAPAEAAPFEPPLRLSADRGKIVPYRARYDIEAPSSAGA